MSDAQTPAAEAPADVAPEAEAPVVETPVTDDLDTWDQARLATEVRKLKAEATQKKERFRPWEEAFDGLPDTDATQFRNFVLDLKSGDAERVARGAAWMRANLDHLSPAEQAAVQDAADTASQEAGGDDEFDPYDRASIEALVEEKAKAIVDAREAARADKEIADKAIAEMNTYVAEELSKLNGLEPLGSREHEDHAVLFDMLFTTANRLDGTLPWKDRLNAAAESIQGFLGKNGKSYMQRKSAEAEVPATPAEAEPPSGAREPRSLAEATASAKERLKKFELPAGTP